MLVTAQAPEKKVWRGMEKEREARSTMMYLSRPPAKSDNTPLVWLSGRHWLDWVVEERGGAGAFALSLTQLQQQHGSHQDKPHESVP
jgi:hypothetical protein